MRNGHFAFLSLSFFLLTGCNGGFIPDRVEKIIIEKVNRHQGSISMTRKEITDQSIISTIGNLFKDNAEEYSPTKMLPDYFITFIADNEEVLKLKINAAIVEIVQTKKEFPVHFFKLKSRVNFDSFL